MLVLFVAASFTPLGACKSKTREARCVTAAPRPEDEFAVEVALLKRWCPSDRFYVVAERPGREEGAPTTVSSGPPLSSPVAFIRDLRPQRPGSPFVPGADIVASYRAVVCDAVSDSDYDPSDPTANPPQQRVTLYDIEIAPEYRTQARAHSVLVVTELAGNTVDQAFSFLGERVLELLDFGDRVFVADLIREATAKSGHTLDTTFEEIEKRVGKRNGPLPSPQDPRRRRMQFEVFQWKERAQEKPPLLTTILAVERWYPARDEE